MIANHELLLLVEKLFLRTWHICPLWRSLRTWHRARNMAAMELRQPVDVSETTCNEEDPAKAMEGDPAKAKEGDPVRAKRKTKSILEKEGQRLLDMMERRSPAEVEAHIKQSPKGIIDYKNDNGCCPLYAAAWHGRADIIKVLLQHNPDVDATDLGGNTTLMLAASVGNANIVEMLLDAGSFPDSVTEEGYTALYHAAEYPSCARLLVKAGANRNIKGPNGQTPIQRARDLSVRSNHDTRGSEAAAILHEADTMEMLQRVAERRAQEPEAVRTGPQLFEACRKGDLEEANRLIELGADIAVVYMDDKGRTALWAACKAGKANIARLLLQSNALVDQCDDDGMTPLMIACQQGKVECAEACMNAGARVNAINKKGFTPLLLAVYNRQTEVANMLLDKGASHQASVQGKTAVEYARMVVRAAPNDARKALVRRLEDMDRAEADAQHEITKLMSQMGNRGR